MLTNDAVEGGNFYTVIIRKASTNEDATQEDRYADCEYVEPVELEVLNYVSTCDFSSEDWASNMDCWTDLTSYGIIIGFFGFFFGAIVLIIVLVFL